LDNPFKPVSAGWIFKAQVLAALGPLPFIADCFVCVLSAGECLTLACLALVAYLAMHLAAGTLPVSLSASRLIIKDHQLTGKI